jgi:hypothetical protein
MVTKKISDFADFSCNVSALDSIRGGKEIAEVVFSGKGIGYCKNCCGTSGYSQTIVLEKLICYDDGTWESVYLTVIGSICE